MTKNTAILPEYVAKMMPLKELASQAYGSRDTVSPQHDASREYTRLACEFYAQQGSLLDLAEALGVTYAGLRRRVTTKDVKPSSGRERPKFDDAVYDTAVAEVLAAKEIGTEEYHQKLYELYGKKLSMAKLATKLGLSSANPLYYGINRVKMRQTEG